MTAFLSLACTAFAGHRLLARGELIDVALAVKAAQGGTETLLTFNDATGSVVDLDLRGTTSEIIARLASREVPLSTPRPQPSAAEPAEEARGRGRPRLGVVAREVTLLPRHWEWLSSQPGGASQVLRRLVDEARKADKGLGAEKAAQTRAYRFLSAMGGDLPGFEEAARALFAGDLAGFAERMAEWPQDLRDYALRLADQR